MAIELDSIGSGFNKTKIDSNFQKIEDELNTNTLRRDNLESFEDNSMKVNLDMNSKRLLNVPTPAFDTDVVRVKDLPSTVRVGDSFFVASFTENVALTSGQVIVNLTSITTTQTSFYVSGSGADRGRLVPTTDYDVDSLTQITLKESYPAGTILVGVQNESVEAILSDVQVFDNVASMKAASLSVGDTVAVKRLTSEGSLVGPILFNIVAGGTGVSDEGYVDLSNGNQAECTTGKFVFAHDQSRGRTFGSIYNWVDELNVVSFADNTNSGDAHVMQLPIDVRRDSHAVLATAGTVGGMNDIDFRTSNFSDYFIMNADSTYQSENFSFLFDTNPSRNDGTKKHGTGLGGLTPSEDTYAFDSAMTIPSNGLGVPVTFPALGVRIEQYLEFRKRSTGTRVFRFTPDTSTTTLTETGSGNTLGVLSRNAVKWGNKEFVSINQDSPLLVNGSANLSRNLSLSSSTSQVFQLTATSQAVATGVVRIIGIGSGGGGFGVYHANFSSDGTTLTIDNTTGTMPALAPEITATLALNAGILELTVAYTTGLGGSARISIDMDFSVRTW
jgi:hypothetical protein